MEHNKKENTAHGTGHPISVEKTKLLANLDDIKKEIEDLGDTVINISRISRHYKGPSHVEQKPK